jgi:hypothetical protein
MAARPMVNLNSKKFKKDMNNLVDYSLGFLDGAKAALPKYLKIVGIQFKEIAAQYIDAAAKMNPEELHHIYEWDKVGLKTYRLYRIYYTVQNNSLVFGSLFKQSTTVQEKRGSRIPFAEKASIMERGKTMVIKPRADNEKGLLTWFDEESGEYVSKPKVTIRKPGGDFVKGSFERTFREFFGVYLSQSRLLESGFFKKPGSKVYKKGLKAGGLTMAGRMKGTESGFRWIISAADIGDVW